MIWIEPLMPALFKVKIKNCPAFKISADVLSIFIFHRLSTTSNAISKTLPALQLKVD